MFNYFINKYVFLGNIKKITRTGESTATIAFAYNGNRISQANNKNYLYNVNGSVLNNGEINISNYNELNLPNRISKANTTMYFTYTADGKKIFKNIDNKEVRFYDDGIEFIKARLDSPNVKLEIINTDDGKIQVKGTKYYYQYFLKDHLGNVRAIVSDSNRAVIQRVDYYAFGKVRLQGDTAIKYLYNGNEYQAGLDVYDFNARTYDPVTGRFLQVDPNVEDGEQQGFNPYHFSYNNPINKSDPSGRVPDDIIISGSSQFMIKTFNDLQKLSSEPLTMLENGKVITTQTANLINVGLNNILGTRGYVEKINGTELPLPKNTGTNLVSSLINSDKVVNITESNDKNFTTGKVNNANLKPDGIKGKGENVDVRYNPNSKIGGINENGNFNRPSKIGLGHELFHAKHRVSGTRLNGNSKTIDPDNKKNGSFLTNEELKTRQEENKLRLENNEPARKVN